MIDEPFATAEAVFAVEAEIDHYMESVCLPADEYFAAIWHYLLTSEDVPRWLMLRSSRNVSSHGESEELMRLSRMIDEHKYALRYLFDIATRRLPKTQRLTETIQTNAHAYTTAHKALELARDYRSAASAFTFYRSGNSKCTIDPQGFRLSFRLREDEAAYGALDYAITTEKSALNPLTVVMGWLRTPESAPPIVKHIGQHTRLTGGDRLQYTFDAWTARSLANALPNPEYWHLVPQQWRFPWGGSGGSDGALE